MAISAPVMWPLSSEIGRATSCATPPAFHGSASASALTAPRAVRACGTRSWRCRRASAAGGYGSRRLCVDEPRRSRCGIGWRARYRAWRSAFVSGISPSGLRPLGISILRNVTNYNGRGRAVPRRVALALLPRRRGAQAAAWDAHRIRRTRQFARESLIERTADTLHHPDGRTVVVNTLTPGFRRYSKRSACSTVRRRWRLAGRVSPTAIAPEPRAASRPTDP